MQREMQELSNTSSANMPIVRRDEPENKRSGKGDAATCGAGQAAKDRKKRQSMKTFPYERVVAGPDTLRLYLKEISQFPQLTPEEEKELGARVQKGDEEAFQKLIEANLRFVVAMAKKYARSGTIA
jgi:DNA-directed RNA polymerase sigma subunit (sigma70/sigma32)